MKLVVTFALVCAAAVGLLVYRMAGIGQVAGRGVVVNTGAPAIEVREDERASTAEQTATEPVNTDLAPSEVAGPAPATPMTDTPPAKPAVADAAESEPAAGVHWAPEGESPAVVRRLAAAREVLASDKNHPTALRDELAALRALGRWAEAELTLARLVALEPDNMQLKMDHARGLVRQGLWLAAIDPLQSVTERQPDNVTAWTLLAAAFQTAGRLDEARRAWTRVIDLASEDAAAYANRGQVYAALQDWPAAAADLERSCEIDPRQPEVALALSQALEQLGRAEEARVCARGVLERNPQHVRAMNHLAELLCQGGQDDAAGRMASVDEAIGWWQRSLEIDPNQPAVRARLAEMQNSR